jgi:ATP-dependent helicase/nuclease subunit A
LSNYSLFDIPHEGKAIIYRSSAGSGKTFTLTKAYLKLVLLDTSRYTEVLAITFTNDAKDEMKNRIIDELTLLAKGENSDMRQAILKDFKEEKVVNIEDVLTSRATTVLNSLLHDYSRFNVSTIDHFFAQLIRHLAKELHLNLGYELDVDSKKALNESIELLFAQADKKTLGWLQDFALEQMDNDKGWDIKKNIATLGKKLFHESYLDVEEKLRQNTDKLESFIKGLKKTVRQFKETLIAQGKLGIDIAHQHLLEQTDFSRGMPYVNMVKIANEAEGYTKPPSKTFIEATSLEKWHTKASDKIELIAQARDAGMGDVHQRIVDMFTGDSHAEFLEAAAILNYIHSYGVLASLAEKVQEYRSSNNLILISDTAFILNKVIGKAEMPFVYEKIGAKYQYILIDEFQDTSSYQWQSLLPFFHNAVDNGGQLFVVGDVKQSIYGWRGGDMKLLLHQVEKDIHVAEENARTLDTNYRSGKNIISFNNTFFKLAPELLTSDLKLDQFLPDFKKAYKDVEQKSTKEFAGLVKLQFFKSEEANLWSDKAIESTIKEINNATADDFSLSDILILTRKRSEASQIANILLNKGISAISEEALMVTSSSKVQLIINSLKFLKNKNDILAIAEFNFFYARVFNKPAENLTAVSDLLKSTVEISTRPVYEIIEELILLLKIPDNGDIYLQQLLDLALTQMKNGNATVTTFLSWWQDEATNESSRDMAIALPGGEEAIKIMTIHKAKGLEYPIVILPMIDSSMAPMSKSILWVKPLPAAYKDWGSLPLAFTQSLLDTSFSDAYYDEYFKTTLEALNLLYVSFTRAVERLYVFSNIESKSPRTGKLLAQVLEDPEFVYSANFNKTTHTFILGDCKQKASAKSKRLVPTLSQQSSSSALSSKLVIEQQQSKLFLSFKSEKSSMVKEGIALHKVMSLIININSIDAVLDKLEINQVVDSEMKLVVAKKIKILFAEIPQMKKWFSGDYEVLNEREIMANGKISIPDRVMIKDNKAIIIDYKREQKDIKHHKQIKNYGKLLADMGYDKIEMYLIYTDDHTLVKVT